jgi:murein DD-endopeptidase MepM/ murein hydrolase activator NlpD
MLVVIDADPNSSAGVRIAEHYSKGAAVLTSWHATPPEFAVEVQTSITSEPTIAEALRAAAQRRIAWVALRRDFHEPERLLSELLIGTARHAEDDIPGFAVFLADGDPTPFRRILAIVDQRYGDMSGLLAYIGVAVADTAGAQLDILVIGADADDLHSEDEFEMLAISREKELYDRAVDRGLASGIRVEWIPAAGVVDPWLVIRDQLSQHDYDLVLDDLGDVFLGGREGVPRTVASALAPGQIGEIPLRLLNEVPVPLLLVIDEIRLGIAPMTLLKAGTAAAITLGMVGVAAMSSTSAAVAHSAQPVEATDALIEELESALGIQPGAEGPPGPGEEPDSDEADERAEEAADASRGGEGDGARSTAQAGYATVTSTPTGTSGEQERATLEEKKGAVQPKPPKGGADPADVQKAQRQAAKQKQALKEEKEKKSEVEADVATAEESLASAQEAAEVVLGELEAARAAYEQAAADAAQAQSDTTGIKAVLPMGATPEEAAVAAEVERLAQERLQLATEVGAAVLEDLTSAEAALVEAEATLADTKAEVQQTKAAVEHAEAKVAVFKESLAKTRQAPVRKGSYRLTARFGQYGGYWSSGIHTGLDFAGSSGTDVLAAASGTVISTGWQGAYGNQVVIDHGNGYETTYNHLSGIRVSTGQKVQTGDHIGDMGSTGNSTGTHLHFEVTHNGKFMDPESWLGW